MQTSYTLQYPGSIVFGEGTIKTLPCHLPPATNLLLVVGEHFRKSDAFVGVMLSLAGHKIHVEAGIPHEAPLHAVGRLIDLGRMRKVDHVVAIGGGSVLDAAKAASAIIPNQGSIEDYFHGRKELVVKSLRFIAVPTTAGTGTELTKNAVLLDTATKVKKSIRHDFMISAVALIDPCLTHSCPQSVMAHSALDALTQAVESYISQNANAASQALALAAVAKIFAGLPTSFADVADTASRLQLAEGSMLSGMAFSQSGLGAVHALAHPIGALFDMPHGLVCAILLPHILKVNLPCREKEFEVMARVCGGKTPKDLVAIIERLNAALQIPAGFRPRQLAEADTKFILANCRSGSMKTNPKTLSDAEVAALLERLFL